MTHHVQEFIESTINLIEKKEYHEVFTIWYVYYSENRHDYDYLSELFEIFDMIEIDLYKESEEARKNIIAGHMYDYLDDVLTNDPDTFEITLPTVIAHLNSKLGISLIDLNNLFKDVTNKLTLQHNVIREPFKIKRN